MRESGEEERIGAGKKPLLGLLLRGFGAERSTLSTKVASRRGEVGGALLSSFLMLG